MAVHVHPSLNSTCILVRAIHTCQVSCLHLQRLKRHLANEILRTQRNKQTYRRIGCIRVVNVWNSLPDHVVDVNSLKLFETRLDKCWGNQDVMFDWTAEITGTGDRSECKLEIVLENYI